jgi:hypothetical protein
VKDIAASFLELESLDLGGEVTDAAIPHLKTLSKLKTLSLFGSKVTDDGVKELQKAIPNCKIDR